MSALDPQIVTRNPDARPKGQRMAAVCAVALIVLSCGLLQSMAQSGAVRPVQSVAWVFGPPPAAADRF